MTAPTMERVRFRVAHVVDRLMPSMCWADLATWALSSWRNPKRLIDCRRGPSCQSDIDRNGSCWCGKVTGQPTHSGEDQA